MDNLILHETTSRQLQAALQKGIHGLLLVGQEGSGKATIALHITAKALETTSIKITQTSSLKLIQPEDNIISIDSIRDILHFLQLKTTGKKSLRRAVIIENATFMTSEAQHAFLKILEEPPADTVIILTAQATQQLLPTLISRLQVFHIKTPPKSVIEEHFAKIGYTLSDIRQAGLLSNYQIGFMTELLSQSHHPFTEAINKAKTILTAPVFERLVTINELTKDKTGILELIGALKRISLVALEQSAQTDRHARTVHWFRILKNIHNSEKILYSNPNSKLLLTNLFLNL